MSRRLRDSGRVALSTRLDRWAGALITALYLGGVALVALG